MAQSAFSEFCTLYDVITKIYWLRESMCSNWLNYKPVKTVVLKSKVLKAGARN